MKQSAYHVPEPAHLDMASDCGEPLPGVDTRVHLSDAYSGYQLRPAREMLAGSGRTAWRIKDIPPYADMGWIG